MIVKTRIFEFVNGEYKNLSELAKAMEISVSQIYRVREGKRHINQKFIIGAMKAFPNRKLDDLFYLAPTLPTVNADNASSIQQHISSRLNHPLKRNKKHPFRRTRAGLAGERN